MFALALISAQFRISKLIFSFVSLYALLQETNTSIWTDVGWENFNASMKMAVQSIHSYDCEAMKARFKDVHAMTAQFSCQLAYLSCHRLTTCLENLKSPMLWAVIAYVMNRIIYWTNSHVIIVLFTLGKLSNCNIAEQCYHGSVTRTELQGIHSHWSFMTHSNYSSQMCMTRNTKAWFDLYTY